MTTFFVENSKINSDKAYVGGEDYFHLKNVLRTKIDEKVYICNENGEKFLSKLVKYDDNSKIAEFEIIEKFTKYSNELPVMVNLYQGFPKSDKFELIIKMCTELGINSIVPVQTAYTVAKMDAKSENKKQARWEKIVKEASMQSGRQKIPTILPLINFENIIENIKKYDIVLLLYENEHSMTLKQALCSNKDVKNIAIIVGPEGGFSNDEVSKLSLFDNVKVVTLGNRILRTETACASALSMIAYEYEL